MLNRRSVSVCDWLVSGVIHVGVAKAGDFVKMMNDLEQMEHESVEATLSKTTELMKTCSGTVFDMKQDIEELNKRNQSWNGFPSVSDLTSYCGYLVPFDWFVLRITP